MYLKKGIGTADLEKYKDLIPQIFLKQISQGELYATEVISCVNEQRDTVAIYLSYIHRNWLEIVWFRPIDLQILPVDMADILRFVTHDAEKRSKKPLTGAFFAIHNDEVTDPDKLRHVLLMAGFSSRQTDNYIYTCTLDDVAERDFLTKAAGALKCIPLGEAGLPRLKEMEEIIQKDGKPSPTGLFVEWRDYDAQDSLVCLNKDHPCGVLLLSKRGEYIVLDSTYTIDKKILPVLLGNAFLNLEKKYGPGQNIFVPVLGTKTAKMLEGLVPAAKKEVITDRIMWY